MRGSKRATRNCPENTSPSQPLAFLPGKGEATFQCPARVCAAAHALKEMEPVVLALASNERYFPGLYCAVASALSHLDATREVDLKVLDGGISQTSRDTLFEID